MQNRLLSAKATLPDYDRAALAARMVHLGFGAFHRAHQGVYTDILAAEQHSDWGYYECDGTTNSRKQTLSEEKCKEVKVTEIFINYTDSYN